MNHRTDSCNLLRFMRSNLRINTDKSPSPQPQCINSTTNHCSPRTHTKVFRLNTHTKFKSPVNSSLHRNIRVDFAEKVSDVANQIKLKDQFGINENTILDNIMELFRQLLGKTEISNRIANFLRSYVFIDLKTVINDHPDISYEWKTRGFTYKRLYAREDMEEAIKIEKDKDSRVSKEEFERISVKLFFLKLKEKLMVERLEKSKKLEKENQRLKHDLWDLRKVAVASKLENKEHLYNIRKLIAEESRLKHIEEKFVFLQNDRNCKSNNYLTKIIELTNTIEQQGIELTKTQQNYRNVIKQFRSIEDLHSKAVSELDGVVYHIRDHVSLKKAVLEKKSKDKLIEKYEFGQISNQSKVSPLSNKLSAITLGTNKRVGAKSKTNRRSKKGENQGANKQSLLLESNLLIKTNESNVKDVEHVMYTPLEDPFTITYPLTENKVILNIISYFNSIGITESTKNALIDLFYIIKTMAKEHLDVVRAIHN